jgi:hypothetical protein
MVATEGRLPRLADCRKQDLQLALAHSPIAMPTHWARGASLTSRGLLLPGFGYVRSVFSVRREQVVLRLLELLGRSGAGTLEFCELIEYG